MGNSSKEYNRAWYAANRDKVKAMQAKWAADKGADYFKDRRRALRAAALAHLGGVCCRCGFSDVRALQIDHVNGGGSKEHRAIRNDGIHRKVLAGEPGYQLLCANCNWIKRVENGES